MKLRTVPMLAAMALAALSLAALSLAAAPAAAKAAKKKCLFVSSYHVGYEHSDAIERGLRAVLEDKCEIRQFDMDAKRRPGAEVQKAQGLAAKAIVEEWKPDIVITADDEAAKHLIVPHFKDHAMPFVFCGINWTAGEYGFPFKNATGMIEVAPILPMLERAQQLVPQLRRAFYIGSASLTEEKNLERFKRAAEQLGLELHSKLVPTTDGWIEAYREGQEYDLVIVGNAEGIKDWNAEKARAAVLAATTRLSVTNHDWMMPWTLLGVTKVSEEQGEWAAKTALRILSGVSPTQIPVVPNSRRDFWVNQDILAASQFKLPSSLIQTAKKVAGLDVR